MQSFGLILFLSCILYLEALKFDNIKSDILPTKEVCGHQRSADHTTSQFPWVVYLPLRSRMFNPQENSRCAGTLISKRYVVVAKSCLQFELTKVHVGRYDTSQSLVYDGTDKSPVEEIAIEERAVDDKIDVVLLRLAKDVVYTDFIRPICLPFEGLKRAEVGETVYSSGWGLKSRRGEYSVTKKQVKETVVKSEDCQKAGFIKNAKDLANFLCVKVQNDSADKACSGDEGSPIMYSSNGKWLLEGVMSWLFDAIDEPCAVTGPAGGPKITEEVLQWILNKIHS